MPRSYDARADVRVPIAAPVNVMVRGRVVLAAIAVNISLGGLALNAAAALPPGIPCDVAISLPQSDGSGEYMAQGTIMRSGENGMAIRFTETLESQALAVITAMAPSAPAASWPGLYWAYFRVGHGKDDWECRQVFGITFRTFSRLSTTTFLCSIPVALLPVWLLRSFLHPLPSSLALAAALAYGAIWLLGVQPFIDLAAIRVLVRRRIRRKTLE